MTLLGTVRELWRYPVSSLGGERLTEAEIDSTGVVGDRSWGGFARAPQEVAPPDRLKRWRPVPTVLARLTDAGPEVTGDGKTWHKAGSSEAAELTGAALGFPVRFAPYEAAATINVPGEPAPRYTRAGLHLLTTASMAHLESLVGPEVGMDARRFRPNVVVESAPGLHGFVDQEWLGRTLTVGDLRLKVSAPCVRCSFTAIAQNNGIAFAPEVLHAITRHGGGDMGIYAEVEVEGTLRLGDQVRLV